MSFMRWAAAYARSLSFPAEVASQFSLRGRWPAERYQKILEIQLYLDSLHRKRSLTYCAIPSEIAYLLSHLMSVLQRLEPAWTRAFLRRTRFLDPDFQGDVLAVISKVPTQLLFRTPADIRYCTFV
jgi:hypothetical protein